MDLKTLIKKYDNPDVRDLVNLFRKESTEDKVVVDKVELPKIVTKTIKSNEQEITLENIDKLLFIAQLAYRTVEFIQSNTDYVNSNLYSVKFIRKVFLDKDMNIKLMMNKVVSNLESVKNRLQELGLTKRFTNYAMKLEELDAQFDISSKVGKYIFNYFKKFDDIDMISSFKSNSTIGFCYETHKNIIDDYIINKNMLMKIFKDIRVAKKQINMYQKEDDDIELARSNLDTLQRRYLDEIKRSGEWDVFISNKFTCDELLNNSIEELRNATKNAAKPYRIKKLTEYIQKLKDKNVIYKRKLEGLDNPHILFANERLQKAIEIRKIREKNYIKQNLKSLTTDVIKKVANKIDKSETIMKSIDAISNELIITNIQEKELLDQQHKINLEQDIISQKLLHLRQKRGETIELQDNKTKSIKNIINSIEKITNKNETLLEEYTAEYFETLEGKQQYLDLKATKQKISTSKKQLGKVIEVKNKPKTIEELKKAKNELYQKFIQSDYYSINPLNKHEKYDPEYYNEPRMRKIVDGKYRTLIEQSPTGTGKTRAILDYCKKHPDKFIVIVTPYRVIAKNHTAVFQEINIRNYMDIKDQNEYQTAQKLIVGVMSFYKLAGRKAPDILIFDESEQISNFLLSDFSFTQKDTWYESIKVLKYFIENCGLLILLDAAITSRSITLVESLRDVYYTDIRVLKNIERHNRSLYIRINQVKPEAKKVILRNHKGNLKNILQLLLHKLKEGKKIAVCSGSKKFANQCAALAQLYDIKYILHTSETANLKAFENVNEHWGPDIQLIIISPTVTTGVSFTGEYEVNEVFSVIFQKSATIRDQFQMTRRFRVVTSQVINLFLVKNGKECITNPMLLSCYNLVKSKVKIPLVVRHRYIEERRHYIETIKDEITRIELLDKLESFIDDTSTTEGLEWAEHIAALNILERICDNKFFKFVVSIYGELYGWIITYDKTSMNELELPKIETDDKPLKFDEIETIEQREYERLISMKRDDMQLTKREREQINKFQFNERFIINDPNAAIVYNSRDKQIVNFKKFCINFTSKDYSECAKDYTNVKKLMMEFKVKKTAEEKKLEPKGAFKEIYDITKPGVNLTHRILEKLTNTERMNYRKLFSVNDIPSDHIEFSNISADKKTAVLIDEVLYKMFKMNLVQKDNKNWITQSNNGLTKGLKSLLKDPSICLF